MDAPAPEPQGYPVGPYTVERYRRLIVDVRGQQVGVYRLLGPSARRHRGRQVLRRGRVIQPVAFPDTGVRMDDLLPVLEN
jgi:hypothetical protein